MQILCVADLHYRRPWFDWVVQHSANYGLTCIAGDLLYDASPFGAQSTIPDWGGGRTPSLRVQTDHVRTLFHEAIMEHRLGRIALCSGNHDIPLLWDPDRGLGGLLSSVVISDNCTAALASDPSVVVTTMPFELSGSRFADRWQDGALQSAGRRWLVLSHLGPNGTKVTKPTPEVQPTRDCIESYPPWVFLCGHLHRVPFAPDGSWYDRLGPTWVFNPGSQDYHGEFALFPPHIVINTEAKTATWAHGEGGETFAQTISLE